MKATILDTETGLTGTQSASIWSWTEGNWSCDCNRDMWCVLEDTGHCAGAKRFLVIATQPEEEDEGDTPTLREANYQYPDELLQKHGIHRA